MKSAGKSYGGVRFISKLKLDTARGTSDDVVRASPYESNEDNALEDELSSSKSEQLELLQTQTKNSFVIDSA